MKPATNIFGDSDSDADAPKITVNRKFATAYEERKRKQELGRARDMGWVNADGEEVDDDDESTSESEDEGDALTPWRDLEIMRTIKMIRSKDPRVYDPATKFYESGSSTEDSGDDADGKKEKKAKPMTAKDVIRTQVLDAVKKGKEQAFDDDDDDDNEPAHLKVSRTEKLSTLVYDDEQAALRKAFTKAVDGEDDDDGFLRPVEDKTADDDTDLVKYVDKVDKLDKKEKEELKRYVGPCACV
jgi:protein KRI1